MGISSIGGTSGTYGSKGMSGLMSGLDVESIVKGMSSNTSGKIAKLLQRKQTMAWEAESYQGISTKLIEFQQKYLSFASSTNLSSENFFSKNSITAGGFNSKYITVSGKSNSADSLQVLGVKNLAEDKTESLVNGSKGSLDTGNLDLGALKDINNVAGKTILVKYDNKEYEITLKDKLVLDPNDSSKTIEFDYSNWNDTVSHINDLISKDPALKPLDGKVKFELNAESKLEIKLTDPSSTLEIKSGTKDILNYFGLTEGDKATASSPTITGNKELTRDNIVTPTPVADLLAEKNMTFSYNGVNKTIKLGDAKELATMTGKQFAEHIQGKLDDAFGDGRVKVDFNDAKIPTDPLSKEGSFSFTTTKPNANGTPGAADNSSVIKLVSSETGIIGKDSILGVYAGASNRVNTSVSLEKSGLKGMGDLKATTLKGKKADGTSYDYQGYAIEVNGKAMSFAATDSIGDIMSKINAANAGVKVTYNEISDTFSLRATSGGASGKIEIKDLPVDKNGKFGDEYDPSNPQTDPVPPATTVVTTGNLADKLFNFGVPTGVDDDPTTPDIDESIDTSTDDVFGSHISRAGKDALIEVDFDGVGQGSGSTFITRNSNNFNLDGLNITVNQTFDSYKKNADGKYVDGAGAILADQTDESLRVLDTDNVIRFTAKADADKIVEAVKKMAEEYNAMADLIEKTGSQKHDKNYPPLTAEQKKDMSEDEIKAWEEKAKEGLLFNDSTLNALQSDLRFVFSSYKAEDIASIGISNSGPIGSSYKNNGKITIDESKLRSAIAERSGDVAKLFAGELSEKVVNGKSEKDITTGGVMKRMEAIYKKYASTTGADSGAPTGSNAGSFKGILIVKAGHPASPTSMFNNAIQKQMDDMDKTITKLKSTLSSEESRYYKQFTRLEQLISQMNSQSGALADLTGGA